MRHVRAPTGVVGRLAVSNSETAGGRGKTRAPHSERRGCSNTNTCSDSGVWSWEFKRTDATDSLCGLYLRSALDGSASVIYFVVAVYAAVLQLFLLASWGTCFGIAAPLSAACSGSAKRPGEILKGHPAWLCYRRIAAHLNCSELVPAIPNP